MTETPGPTFLMLMPDHAHTGGVRMVWLESAIITNVFAWGFLSGTARILSSRNVSSVLLAMKGTTARM